MGDRYRERWERRQARWDARRAKWEARAARHEAHRVRQEARCAAREARRVNWEAGRGSPDKSTMTMMGVFGGLFILLGLFFALRFPGAGALASLVVCLIPGAAMLVPWMIWARRRSGMPAAEAGDSDARSRQATPQVAEVQDAEPDQVSRAKPQAVPKAPPVHEQVAERPQPKAGASNPDPSYYRERAAGYRRRIQSIIRNRRPGPLADMMSSVVTNLQQWEERVGLLADRLTTFERDSIIQRDIREVPANIVRLRGQIEIESDAGIHEQMERTLTGYQGQQTMLDTLVRLMRRTRLLLDDTLVSMGTIYSQIRVIDASDIESAQTARIAEELDEQVNRLNDLLSALGDTYRGANQPAEPADSAQRIRLERNNAAGG